MLKKNSFLLGLVIGIIIPLTLFGLLYGLNFFTKVFEHPPVILPMKKMMFICTALNILPVRYCFIKNDLEKTGQGVLFVTVFLILMITLGF
jgi:hypothetical protein